MADDSSSRVIDPAALEHFRTLGGDALVRELIEVFIPYVEQQIEKLERDLAGEVYDQVALAAHSIKSSAGNFRAHRLRDLAEKIEHLADQGENTRIAPLLPKLKAAYTEVKVALEEILKSI